MYGYWIKLAAGILELKKEVVCMTNIKPISDLRNYTEVLNESDE